LARIEYIELGQSSSHSRSASPPRAVNAPLQQAAVLQRDDIPVHVAEHGIKALAVVVDDPPHIPDVVLPAFEHRFEDVAFVELGVAHEGDHPPGRLGVGGEALQAHVILDERGKARDRHTKADRPGRKIDVVMILGTRRIRLRTVQRAKAFEILFGLTPEQVLDRVEDRARVRLDGDPVVGLQHVEIERRHQRDERRRRGLVAANLQPVELRPQDVGVVDRPHGQPQHLAFDRLKTL
jgi:hypothetical protein